MFDTEVTIREIMTTDIITVHPDDTLYKVEEIFDIFPIHHILVVDRYELKGVITHQDLLRIYRKELTENLIDRTALLVKHAMTPNPLTLDCEDSIGLAADIFMANKFHSVPVLDGQELAGILTNHDILRYAFGR
jgi:acetoin utilization protein AcuB